MESVLSDMHGLILRDKCWAMVTFLIGVLCSGDKR